MKKYTYFDDGKTVTHGVGDTFELEITNDWCIHDVDTSVLELIDCNQPKTPSEIISSNFVFKAVGVGTTVIGCYANYGSALPPQFEPCDPDLEGETRCFGEFYQRCNGVFWETIGGGYPYCPQDQYFPWCFPQESCSNNETMMIKPFELYVDIKEYVQIINPLMTWGLAVAGIAVAYYIFKK